HPDQAVPPATRHSPDDPRIRRTERQGGVTPRAILVALLLLVAIAPINFYTEIVWGANWDGIWFFATGMPAVVPVISLMLLTLVLSLPVLRRANFTRRELLAVYSVVLVGAPVLSHAVLCWMLVKNVAYYYAARAQPHWETMFLQHVPTWFAPSDPAAVEGFFEGQVPVPWSLWWTPLAAWSGFLLALFTCTFCLMALVQRQWVTHERLTFPLAQIPLEMLRSAGPGEASVPARLTTAWPFWLGVLIAFTINFLSTLSQRVPAIPNIPVSLYDIIPWQRVGPLAGIGGITILLWPWMIAIAYLIPKELSFSVWFFTIIRHLLTVVAIAAGATPMRPEDWWGTSFPAPYHQGGGAVLALALWVLWIARKHLGRALRIAFSRRSRGQDADEPLPYRAALIGLVLSTAFMVGFFRFADCRSLFGLALVGLTVGYFAIWARLRAETGLGFLCFPLQIQDVALIPFGTRFFRVPELVTLITMRWAYTPGFGVSSEVFPGGALEGFKIADSARLNARRLSATMIAGFILSLVLGVFIFMTGVYHFGWFGLSASSGGWLGPQSIGDGGSIVSFLTDESRSKPDVNGLIALITGGVVVILLGLMRLKFWWWPLHPVGYIAANTWGSHWWFVPFVIGWASKTLVIRYGGLRLYRATVPLAIGLIVGDLLNGALWATLQMLSRGQI
ncbi:MAG: hypothetical protein MUQ65_09285, partial [Armatimonadetes bacterium]|nr:hypothetical protein [Armatimonadota bacterium]